MQITLILAAIFNIIGGLTILFLQRFIAPLIHLGQVAREKRAAVSRGGVTPRIYYSPFSCARVSSLSNGSPAR